MADIQAHVSVIPTGEILDNYVLYANMLSAYNTAPVGIEWDTSSDSPALRYIDFAGNTITPGTEFFNRHILWNIRECARNRTTGAISYSGYSRTGSSGDIMVEYPMGGIRYWASGTKRRIWVVPYNFQDTRFLLHPAAVQRGGVAHPHIYEGAYEASIRINSSGNVCLQSVAGVQPLTGGTIYNLSFTSGSTAFTIGETLTGATSTATGIVVAVHKVSGDWGVGDAAGNVYLEQHNPSIHPYQAEILNGSTSGSNCANASAAASTVNLYLEDAETYGNNVGTGCGASNFWTNRWSTLLMIIEAGTFDIQSVYGTGVCNQPIGTGFAGKRTGADSIDSRLNEYGTGTGSGVDGSTPIKWRWKENPYGNVLEWLTGFNMYLSGGGGAGSYRVLPKSGTTATVIPATLTDYESGAGRLPLTDGYITQFQTDLLGAIGLLPLENSTGSSTTYMCDYFIYPRADPSGAVVGGGWGDDYPNVGPLLLRGSYATTNQNRMVGCRLEYVP